MKVALLEKVFIFDSNLIIDRPLLEVTALNRDHKPELKDEAERILKMGGRMDSFRDYYNGGEPVGP